MLNISLYKPFAESVRESIKSSEHSLRKYEGIKSLIIKRRLYFLKKRNMYIFFFYIYTFRKYLLEIISELKFRNIIFWIIQRVYNRTRRIRR